MHMLVIKALSLIIAPISLAALSSAAYAQTSPNNFDEDYSEDPQIIVSNKQIFVGPLDQLTMVIDSNHPLVLNGTIELITIETRLRDIVNGGERDVPTIIQRARFEFGF